MMRRTPIARKTPMKRSAMKRGKKRKQIAGHHDKSMLEACKGEPCFLAIPGVCLGEAGRDTVVPCHSNSHAHGKSMGLKAKDEFTVPGCFSCHAYLDQSGAPKGLKQAIFETAHTEWAVVREAKLKRKA